MHDIDFNPFNDLQAEDRVHRIGQKKKTTVIKLVAADTVDADIYEMQQRKARMNAAIMDSDWNKEEAKAAKDQVLQTAVDRFLSQSPADPTPEKALAAAAAFGKDDGDDDCKADISPSYVSTAPKTSSLVQKKADADSSGVLSSSEKENGDGQNVKSLTSDNKTVISSHNERKESTGMAASGSKAISLVDILDSDASTTD